MKRLALLIALLFATGAALAQGVTVTPAAGAAGGTLIDSVTALPVNPSLGQIVVVTDDSVQGACDSAAGSAVTLCRWNGSGWASLGDGQAAGGTLVSTDIDTSSELRTILTDETGTGALYFQNGDAGTPSALVGTNISGTAAGLTAGAAPLAGITGLGVGIDTALAINVGSAGAPVLFNGAGGTPSSITLTNAGGTAASLTAGLASALAANPANCGAGLLPRGIDASGACEGGAAVNLASEVTGTLPAANGGTGVTSLASGMATWWGAATSANLAATLTNETGSGLLVFGTAPTIDSAVLTTKFNAPSVAAFPGTPASGDIVIITDDSVAGACDSAAGSARSWCQWNGSSWVSIGDGTAGGGATAVTATSTFATDNVLVRSDGTSRGVQNSGIAINDLDDVSGVGDLSVGGNATITGTVTASNLAPLSGALTSGGAIWTDGTNISSSAALANNGLVIGGGTGFGPETVAGLTSDGASQIQLGVAGVSVGSVQLSNVTSGSITLAPTTGALGTVTATFPATTGTVALTSGNVATATALAADPTDCAADRFATTIAASGNLTCAQVALAAAVSGTLPVANGGTGITAFGTGVATALGQNVTGTGGIALATGPTLSGSIHTSFLRLPRVTAFPGTPTAGDVVIVTDDSTAGACDSAAGSVTSLCQFDGAAWVKLGDGTAAGGALSSADIDTSAELRAIVTDESGTGALLFQAGDVGAATATTPAANDNDTSVATTAYVQTEFTAYASDTATFTNKTLDAAGTGNILTQLGYIQLTHPDLVDGTGCTVGTTSTAIGYGRPTCSNSADLAANYVEWYIRVPDDLNTGVELAGSIKFLLGAADTATHRYVLSTVSVADSAVPTASTLATAINLDFAGDGSGASGDVESVAFTTLTGWGAALTAGQTWRIRLARDGDATEDASTVNSTVLNVTLRYTKTQ